MKRIFAVILNWNKAELTIDCLKSIDNLKKGDYALSVIVIDNASSNDSVSKIKSEKFTNISFEVIENKENYGFAKGNNIGIEIAQKKGADYILLLNNDTLVDGELLNKLLSVFKKDKKVGMVSPKIYFAPGYEFHKNRYQKRDLGRVIWYAGGKFDWKNVLGSNNGVDQVDKGQFDKTVETDFATGSCILVNRKALDDVGLFEEDYYMYLEDVDLSLRMKRRNWKVIYCPEGFLWHKVAQSSAIGSSLNDYFISRNRMLFGIKYAPARSKAALIKESLKLLWKGRQWQKIGVRDYYLMRFGRGSWNEL